MLKKRRFKARVSSSLVTCRHLKELHSEIIARLYPIKPFRLSLVKPSSHADDQGEREELKTQQNEYRDEAFFIRLVVLLSSISVCLLSMESSSNLNSSEYMDNETRTESDDVTSPAYQNPDNHVIITRSRIGDCSQVTPVSHKLKLQLYKKSTSSHNLVRSDMRR